MVIATELRRARSRRETHGPSVYMNYDERLILILWIQEMIEIKCNKTNCLNLMNDS